MSLDIRSRAQLIQDLVSAIKERDGALETGYGPVKDIVIDPVSLVLRQQYLQIQRAYDAGFLANAEVMDIEELDLLGESFAIKRKGPQKAKGSVFFFTSSKPTADLTIPAGIPVATQVTGFNASDRVGFITTRSVTLFAASADAFFNPATGVFEIEAPIEALSPGAEGRVAPGTIRQIQRQIPGLTGVINKSSTTGGRNAESNLEYARRIRLALLGTDRGTTNGVKRFVLSDDRIIDAIVVMSGDLLMKRTDQVAGAVDIYVIGEETAIDQQIITYDSLDVLFRNEPLIFPAPVSRVTGNIAGVLTEGVHYFIVPDILTDGSKRARNILRWNRSATGLPADGESVTIEYAYDKLIQDMQEKIELAQNDILADCLLRRADQITIQLTATVKITGEVSQGTVEDGIRSAVRTFVNTRGLGEDIVPSDLDVVIRSVPGVDFVILPFTLLCRSGQESSGIIDIEKNEYPQISDTAIALTLSL